MGQKTLSSRARSFVQSLPSWLRGLAVPEGEIFKFVRRETLCDLKNDKECVVEGYVRCHETGIKIYNVRYLDGTGGVLFEDELARPISRRLAGRWRLKQSPL